MAIDKDALRLRYEELRQERLSLERMLASPAWKILRLSLEATAALKQLELQQAANSMDGAFETAFIKGQIIGAKLLISLPDTLIANRVEDEAAALEELNASEEVKPDVEEAP